jgi:uncharacterized membrane protein
LSSSNAQEPSLPFVVVVVAVVIVVVPAVVVLAVLVPVVVVVVLVVVVAVAVVVVAVVSSHSYLVGSIPTQWSLLLGFIMGLVHHPVASVSTQ